MEPVVNYLEDAEKKLTQEMANLFSKMREQRDNMSLEGIEDMYSYTPVEGVLYEPCVRIPMSLGPRKGHYYWNDFTLPKDEYVIFINETTYQHQRGQSWDAPTYKCIALTNHGRCFISNQVTECRDFSTNCFIQYSGTYSQDINVPIIKLDPLPCKMPTNLFKTYALAFKLACTPVTSLHCPNTRGGVNEVVIKTLSDTTASLQELNKEFYLFAGKWKPHMTEHATLDVDSMRQTILKNADSIEILKANEASLELQNKCLQDELRELKIQKAALKEAQAKLLHLEKYKMAVQEFMTEHVNYKHTFNPRGDDNIIDEFKQFHSDKVFMDSWEYDDVIKSKDELNEYRIYKKVKGEMVSTGMDNSSVSRNVRNIKESINQLNRKQPNDLNDWH